MAQPETSWSLNVRCAGCGAELTIEPDRRFVDCEFCGASSILDLGTSAPCFRVRSALGAEAITTKLLAWFRQQGLDAKDVEVTLGATFLHPFWVLEAAEGTDSFLACEQADLPLPPDTHAPAGQLESFDPETANLAGTNLVELTMPLAAAFERFGPHRRSQGEVKASLVYAPFVEVSFTYRRIPSEALVDASTGKVHASSTPRPHDPELDRKLVLLLIAAVVSYGGIAFLPGVLLPLAASALVSIPLGWAMWRAISRKEIGR